MRLTIVLIVIGVFAASLSAQKPGLEPALLRAAGTNEAQIRKALEEVPSEQRGDLVFLLEGMRRSDLETLEADFLIENLALAHLARQEAPWGDELPEEVFRNAVLPYAQVDESRHPWRADFHRRFHPLVAEATSPGEAALILNRAVFHQLGVRYSTKRERANQSPKESIAQGLASCTGLSIILADACRAVGVPARLAGVANWSKKAGNHTWVEVWSDGRWHFLGAAEPSDRLDDAWFSGDAAEAVVGSREQGVFAVNYARTGSSFPMVWSPEDRDVAAVEVTQRYRAPEKRQDPSTVRLMITVSHQSKRVAVPVRIDRVGSEVHHEGTSRGEEADLNDLLEFHLPKEGSWRIRAGVWPDQSLLTWRAGSTDTDLVEVELPDPARGLPEKTRTRLRTWFSAAFEATVAGRDLPPEPAELSSLLLDEAGDRASRAVAFEAYRESTLVADLRADFDATTVRSGKHQSAYTVKSVGARPAGGWPLVIALHGGGGAPKEVNDQQWQHMQIYYNDHPEAGGYIYLALRAPNDTWNGFYDDYVYPLIERLIQGFLLFGDVDPDRVQVVGYSHGGYGVFSIAPKIPYRFAAAHASASAPTDGQTSARPLRNLPFSFMVGGKDTAYGRAKRCQDFASRIGELQSADLRAWPVAFLFEPDHGHGGLPDRDLLPRLLVHRRDPRPRSLDWELTDGTVQRHYWLATDQPGMKRGLRADLEGNTLVVVTEGMSELRALLDARMLDLRVPLELTVDGETRSADLQPLFSTLARTLAAFGDPQLAGTVELSLISP